MMTSTNCPNCGAPRTGDVCEYCGTHFARAPAPEMYVHIDYDEIRPDIQEEVIEDIFGKVYTVRRGGKQWA